MSSPKKKRSASSGKKTTKSGQSVRTNGVKAKGASVQRAKADLHLRGEIGGWILVFVLFIITLGVYLKGALGVLGATINQVLVGIFGFTAYLITLYSLVLSLLYLFGVRGRKLWVKFALGYVGLILLSALLHVFNGLSLNTVKLMYTGAGLKTGGVVGGVIGRALYGILGQIGAVIVLIFVLLILLILITERSAVGGLKWAGAKSKETGGKIKDYRTRRQIEIAKLREQRALQEAEAKAYADEKTAFEYEEAEEGSDGSQIRIKDGLEEESIESGDSLNVSVSSASAPIPKKEASRVSSPAPAAKGKHSFLANLLGNPQWLTREKEKKAALEKSGRHHIQVEELGERRVPRTTFDDGAVDIPLLDSDPYMERKKRFQERLLEESGIRREDAESPIEPELAPQIQVSAPMEEQEIEAKEPMPARPSLSAQKEPEETPASEAKSAPSAQDSSHISTERMFSKEAFPTGYEENHAASGKETGKEKEAKKAGPTGKYHLPPLNLLSRNTSAAAGSSREELLASAKNLESVLLNYGVEAKVVQVNRGPAVTRYELQPKQGVKVSRIVNLTDDIAMNLAASSIRIEAPIPGKSAVGIEIPNKEISMVTLRDVLESKAFRESSSNLTFALGKDIDGVPRVADIAKMPHLLIAGATGSGKSVCINSLIISLIYKANPNDVKLILIDPKVVELSIYNGIPHLMMPVVNDPKQAAATLNWAVQEMTRRYKQFADLNVRDIRGYNEAISRMGDQSLSKMPQIVIVIDELADLMMVSSKDVEYLISRLTQMARAAGIHLVIATQRPSVDVITGLIKANIPSRIAFAVSSGIDSRTILDSVGAEKLLGRGDMLYFPMSSPKPVRIQGTFVSDQEVESVVNFVQSQGFQSFDQELISVLDQSSSAEVQGLDDDIDEYLEEAIKFVVDKQKASVSALQRVFKIGFNRGARLMDALEKRGVVGPEEGSKPRTVLMTKEEWENKYT